jgi:glycerol uptake facilitator-like aquaporin
MQILSTMIFMLVICVVTDKKYSNVPNFLQPFYIGFALLAMGVAYGSNGGYALNPVSVLAYLYLFIVVTFAFVSSTGSRFCSSFGHLN